MLTFGSHGLYEWLTTDDQRLDLLGICPEIVLGKYIAITSIDSGTFLPTDERRVGRVGARLHTARRFATLTVSRVTAMTSGTSSSLHPASGTAILGGTFLNCLKRRDR
jgi:hypothetical protein